MTEPATTTAIPDQPDAPAQVASGTPPLVLLAADDAVVCVDDVCATLPVDDVPVDARPGDVR